MNLGKYVFAQICEFVPHNDFLKFVKKYGGDRKNRHFSCWNQFLCMALGQLTHRESLSDTVMCIGANTKKLYHPGIGKAISKLTLSRANKKRDWRIYRDLALSLISRAKELYKGDSQLEVDINDTVFLIDSSANDLCLSLYPWAKFRKAKAAVKMHAKMDAKNSIPDFIHIERQDSRCQRTRHNRLPGWCLLCNGHWLPRLRKTLPDTQIRRIFFGQGEEEHEI